MDEIIKNSNFTQWTLDEKRSYKEGVPKAHYELEYTSNLNKNANYILLDILFEDSHYPSIQSIPIATFWIASETEIFVNTPTSESILGDKLTAFAPNTTGIRYGRRKEQEIIKQLFDISYLFDEIESLGEVRSSFEAFAQQEIQYRNLTIKPDKVLEDSIDTSKLLSKRGRNISPDGKPKFSELQVGITRFGGYTISGFFPMDKAVSASAKAALIATKLKLKDDTPLIKFDGQNVADLIIEDQEWNFLNRLKKLPDKSAFFHWYEV